MGEVIKIDFKNRKSSGPARFYMPWVSAHYERCICPSAWTYHVKFRVYETRKNFAVQFSRGIGSEGSDRPSCFSNSSPVYRKSLEKLWAYIFSELERYKADIKAVESRIRAEAV